MSGGHFYGYHGDIDLDALRGAWRDEELNELFEDLFGLGYDGRRTIFGYTSPYMEHNTVEFGPRGGGLFESLDFWLSGDTTEEDYLADLKRFKAKWFKRTPKNRAEYYQQKFEQYARELLDKFKEELGGEVEE